MIKTSKAYSTRTVTACGVPRPRLAQRTCKAASSAPHAGSTTDTKKTFLDELRGYAMKLHTKEQAPKEGGQEAAPKPKAFAPTRQGYLQFLAESKVVYDTMERIMKAHPQYAGFVASGLERGPALAQDIAWFKETYGLEPVSPNADGPGMSYSTLLEELAASNPPAFICHYYNHYFAHTAGGRMIGNKVASMILDGKVLAFYQWDGDLTALQTKIRASINDMAAAWTPEQQQACLEETAPSFKYAGSLMRCMADEH